MKKRMTLADLDAYFRAKPAAYYTYAADGQDWAKENAPFWFALSFRELLATEATRSVVLQTKPAFVLFQDVESVEVDEDWTVLGPVIRLRCGPGGMEHFIIAVNDTGA